jgi:hypothetical protein
MKVDKDLCKLARTSFPFYCECDAIWGESTANGSDVYQPSANTTANTSAVSSPVVSLPRRISTTSSISIDHLETPFPLTREDIEQHQSGYNDDEQVQSLRVVHNGRVTKDPKKLPYNTKKKKSDLDTVTDLFKMFAGSSTTSANSDVRLLISWASSNPLITKFNEQHWAFT